MKDIVIITSIIHIRNDIPLYYRRNRNVFTYKQRYLQTLYSIESIKSYFHNPHRILFIECSNITNPDWERTISSKVDDYINVYSDPDTVSLVESRNKNLGEVKLLLKAFSYLYEEIAPYENIRDVYKLSGRYYLEPFFNHNIFTGPLCVSKLHTFWNPGINIDNPDYKLNTIFYKIPFQHINVYIHHLEDILSDSKNEQQCCEYFLKIFFEKIPSHTKILDSKTVVGVSGLISDTGWKVTF